MADRVLPHVDDPLAALTELVRTLARAGRLVVTGPDQQALVVRVPGVRPELADRVKALRRDLGYRHGTLISSLPASLPELGVVEVDIEAFALCLTDPDEAFGMPGWPRLWRQEGPFSDLDLQEWDEGIARAREGGFVYAVTYFVVSASKA